MALDLASEFRLPLRLPPVEAERSVGFPFRELAAAEGVISPDDVVRAPRNRSARSILENLLADLRPGVTEVVLRPAVDAADLRSVAPDWAARVEDGDLARSSDSLRAAAGRRGVVLAGYQVLRELQRT